MNSKRIDVTNRLIGCPRGLGLHEDCSLPCEECWRRALAGRRVYIEYPCKPQNRPNDERKTDKGMFSPKDAEMDVFKANVDKDITELNRGIMQLETEIEMLWSEVEYLKGKTK